MIEEEPFEEVEEFEIEPSQKVVSDADEQIEANPDFVMDVEEEEHEDPNLIK